MEIQEELKQQAVSLGLCKQWQDEWVSPDLRELCSKYIRGLDFCIKHDYPSLAYLEEHFRGKTEPFGIYISEYADVSGQRNVIANGDCRLYVNATCGCAITIRHNSEVHIVVPDDVLVYVSLYDNGRLFVEQKGLCSRVCVSHFGGTIKTPQLVDKVYEKG
ncbi:MAG: hypothetical protein NC038_04065 [Paludibacter sp.]|nr:hypothetical protein [Bacteroides sp.]MCM1403036.1 hypothetical protein [Bacteroides sp.]MCM1442827.1 hypothetical protein [Muribaculum sp.]MCM1481807.1 hypothetical protein [Paludibacter sp.]MCM1576190.1 hypothetical protein [Bacteroides sp.]